MKIRVERTTRPLRGETRGFKPETLYAEAELYPEDLQALLDLDPRQLFPVHTSEEEDCRYRINHPLMFHTIINSRARRARPNRRNPQLVLLVDFMRDHLADDWELCWSSFDDIQLQLHTESQEVTP